jgi:small subunit ribosomal protein S10
VALSYLYKIARFIDIIIAGEISLPTRIKRFTVIKSPHKYKASREQFQYTTYKKCIIVRTNNFTKGILFIKLLKDCEFVGVEVELQTLSKDYFIQI